MTIIGVIIVLIIIGVVLWLVNQYVPMQPAIKNILNIVVVLVVILWLLGTFFPVLFYTPVRVR